MTEHPFFECKIQGIPFHIPSRMGPGITRYLEHRVQPGSFLSAVICNDLQEAVGWADEENVINLPAYAYYFYNEVDSRAWGSVEAMKRWLEGAVQENT